MFRDYFGQNVEQKFVDDNHEQSFENTSSDESKINNTDEAVGPLASIMRTWQDRIKREPSNDVEVNNQFFKPMESSGLSYLMLVQDVKQLLQTIKEDNLEAYVKYHTILKRHDKPCGDTAEDFRVVSQLKKELSEMLAEENDNKFCR